MKTKIAVGWLVFIILLAGVSTPAPAGPFDGPEPGYHAKLNRYQGLMWVSGFGGDLATLSITKLGPSGEPVDPLWHLAENKGEKFVLSLRVPGPSGPGDQLWVNPQCVAVKHAASAGNTGQAYTVIVGISTKVETAKSLSVLGKTLQHCGLTGEPKWRSARQSYYVSLLEYPGQSDLWARLSMSMVDVILFGVFGAIPSAAVAAVFYILVLLVQRLRKKRSPGAKVFFWSWLPLTGLLMIAVLVSSFP